MRQFLVIFLLCLQCALGSHAQEDLQRAAAGIVEEARELYRSEMASWNGTDMLAINYHNDIDKVGGYISYAEDGFEKCIFFSREDSPRVMMTVVFDSTFEPAQASSSMLRRPFTPLERSLYNIRRAALKEAAADTALFEMYNNTSYNFIPIIYRGQKKVYIITGTTRHNVVIFGNDYLLSFDKDDKLLSKKKLHRNIIPTPYGNAADSSLNIMGGAHTHLPETGPFMSVTDVCTLMLYAKYANWGQYTVASDKYISIWSREGDKLLILPYNGYDKLEQAAPRK